MFLEFKGVPNCIEYMKAFIVKLVKSTDSEYDLLSHVFP